MAKNKGKNNSNDNMKGSVTDVAEMDNSQMQNKSGGKKNGAQNKAGGHQDYK